MKWLGKLSAGFIIIGAIMSVGGAPFSIWIPFIGLSILLIGVIMLFYWSTKNFIWKCSKCNNTFEITWQQNLLGMNMGVNDKLLYCPYCKDKIECIGRKKV